MTETTSFLRWAGSKRQILSKLAPFWPAGSRYVEPFVGSACLFFRIAPTEALLGDLNKELIQTYRAVRDDAPAVHDLLLQLTRSKEEYYRIRSLNPRTLHRFERAARFIYLNRFCFNGLYRTNMQGQFNVPYGAEKAGELPSLCHLQACGQLLRNARLIDGSYEKTLEKVREGDFVYMDPPFSVAARRVFKEYNASVFTDEDVRTLRAWMERLAGMRISFLVSYADSDEAQYLAQGFPVHRVSVRRHIAGAFTDRIRSSEVLIHYSAAD